MKKVSSIEKGDLFEEQSYDLIIKLINEGKLAIPLKNVKVFKKKKYYSEKRKKDIIFDLAIELWPQGANNFSILYLIECKNYGNKKVPVGDIESFESKINQISEHNTKGIFISNSGYQISALELSKSLGLMIIDVNSNNESEIIFYKSNKRNSEEDNIICNFLVNIFSIDTKIYGLKKLSKDDLEKKALVFLEGIIGTFGQNNDKVSLKNILKYLEKKYNVKILYEDLGEENLGYSNLSKNIIYINEKLKETDKHTFVIAHEIGHILLHKNLKKNNIPFEIFKDSEFDIFSGKKKLKTDLDWIEWQANYFAGALLMPAKSLHIHLMAIQEKIGNRGEGFLYVDNQHCNQKDYKIIIDYLSNYFSVSKLSLRFRLENLGYLKFSEDYNDNYSSFSNLF